MEHKESSKLNKTDILQLLVLLTGLLLLGQANSLLKSLGGLIILIGFAFALGLLLEFIRNVYKALKYRVRDGDANGTGTPREPESLPQTTLGGRKVLDDTTFHLDTRFCFSEQEFTKIRHGYSRSTNPSEQRWYIECEGNTVYILRSANPCVMFKIPFEKVGDKYVSTKSLSAFGTHSKDLKSELQKQNHWNFWMFSLISQLVFKQPPIMGMDNLALKSEINFNGLHGFTHWQQVYRTGTTLSKEIDSDVLFLFAVFHDFFRENDYHDPKHSERACKYVDTIETHARLVKHDLRYLKKMMEKLEFAIRYHTLSPKRTYGAEKPVVTR